MIRKLDNWMESVFYSSLKCEYYKKNWESSQLSLISDQNLYVLPILEKDEVRKKTAQFINTDYNIDSLIAEFTSGSTGIPITCYKSQKEHSQLGLILHQLRRNFHPNISYKRMVEFLPVELPIQLIKQDHTEKLILSSCFNNQNVLAFYWREILKFNPTFIQGFPSSLLALVIYALEHKLVVDLPQLTCLESRAESLTTKERKLIEEVFKFPLSNHYGSKEFSTIAYSCKEGNMHIASNSVHIEIVDKEGQPINSYEYGDILVTGKIHLAMPLVRYRIGDVGRFNVIKCSCGSNEPILEILGRTGESVLTRKGPVNRSVLSQIWLLLNPLQDIVQIQVEQKSYESFHIKYTGKGTIDCDVEAEIQQALKRFLKSDIIVTTEKVNMIIPDSKTGKVRSFIPLA